MVPERIDELCSAPADRLPGALRALSDLLGDGGGASENGGGGGSRGGDSAPGAAAVARLTTALPTAPAFRQPHLVLALGLLADTGDPAVTTALRKGLDGYLALVPGAGRPLLRALLYLLGHFPDDRRRILAAFDGPGPGTALDGPGPDAASGGPGPSTASDGPGPSGASGGPGPHSPSSTPRPDAASGGPGPSTASDGPGPSGASGGPGPDSPSSTPRPSAASDCPRPSPDERSRLDRSLSAFDPRRPVIGRVWPAPLAWSLDEEESDRHLAWVRTLPAGAAAATWQNDTRTLHAYAGAKALWTAEHGLGPDLGEPAVRAPAVPRAPAGAAAAARSGLTAALRCPSCRSPLEDGGGRVRCTGCASVYPESGGFLDLGSDTGPGEAVSWAPAARYERMLRPAVLRLTGGNWDGALTPAGEDAFLREQVRPVAGPVLDAGCGPGRWTAVLAAAFGQERIVALDRSPTMLGLLGRSLPDTVRIAGDAGDLPFADASLGAAVLWNTLQALPDPARAVAEAGRCLRPGGTFTLLTFRTAADPVHALFQRRLTVRTFADGEVEGWLRDAGLTVTARREPGTLLLLSAVRAAR
ncbi:methyltransferase domain-containing protein [Streptomyces sp. NPDC003691]